MRPAASRVSFHDPDGSVYLDGPRVLRALLPQAARRVEAFLATNTCRGLIDAGKIPATVLLQAACDGAAGAPSDAVWFEHERLPFINYPHEWTPEQLAEACLLTLDLATALRLEGWDLKDGNARNVVFDGMRPVFVDFGSFQARDDSSPVWRAAGQLQRHVLLPLLAQRHLGLDAGGLLLGRPDGMSHAEAYRLLGPARWTDRHVFWVCTLPVLLSRWAKVRNGTGRSLSPEICRSAVDRTINGLRSRCESILGALPAPASEWAGYESARTHYSEDELALKRRAVEEMLKLASPTEVLDIGTNGGEFANLAASLGGRVVSIDSDGDALRIARRAARDAGRHVLHLRVDFTAPTPAIGWNGVECLSFDDRCRGRFDLVMALAVMHHVLVSGGIPLDDMVAKMASYTRGWLLIEYVDPADTMFSSLARQRAVEYSSLDDMAFERALARHFSVVRRTEVIPGRRTLYLCRLAEAN